MRGSRIALSMAALLVAPTSFRVATIPFAELVQMSDTIVVGTVQRIDEAGEARGALLQVDQVIRGDVPEHRLAFLASPTWTCDVTQAIEGERVLLFLHHESDEERLDASWQRSAGEQARDRAVLATRLGAGPLLRVSHSGRGRMPVHDGSADEHVHALGDIRELASVWDKCPDGCSWRYARPLAAVLADVRALLVSATTAPQH